MNNIIKKRIFEIMFDESINYGDPSLQPLYNNFLFITDDDRKFIFNKNDGRFVAVGENFESWKNLVGSWKLETVDGRLESSDYYILFFDDVNTKPVNTPPLIVSPMWNGIEKTQLYCKVDYDYEKDGSNEIIIYQDGSWEYVPKED